MLIYEYKLHGNKAQYIAIDEAIRITQFIRNKALRLWMETRGTNSNDLQCYCAVLARSFPFASRLNSQARQAAADRAWSAISRFYDNCRNQKPGKKGYPRFQHDNRSVEYKQTVWKLETDGKHITFTDGCSIGRLRLVGNKGQRIEEYPLKQIKRVRIIKRADGYYAQFALEAQRHVEHVNTGKHAGIDMGLGSFLTDSEGNTVANPRHLLSVRTHICTGCGMVLDRDHNAALNILQKAYRTVGQTETGTPERVRNASGQTTPTRSRRAKTGK